jgi:hypothetical protein
MCEHMNQASPVVNLLAAYPPNVQAVALQLRDIILSVMPDAREMPDSSSKLIAYGFGTGYKDIICTIIPSKSGVKLGIARGASLPDPDALLRGAGKLHRYVPLTKPVDLDHVKIERLLNIALDAWRKRGGQ